MMKAPIERGADFDEDAKKRAHQVVAAFDEHAKKRAAELLVATPNEPLQATREIAFCLGYKAGIVDLGTSLRERLGVSVDQLEVIFRAACAWRDSSLFPDAIAGEFEQQLIAAIDVARKERP
jgi:hypothetical protein